MFGSKVTLVDIGTKLLFFLHWLEFCFVHVIGARKEVRKIVEDVTKIYRNYGRTLRYKNKLRLKEVQEEREEIVAEISNQIQ